MAKHSTFISAGLVNFHRNKLCFGLSQSKDIKSWFKYFGVCTPPAGQMFRGLQRLFPGSQNIIFEAGELVGLSDKPKFVFVYIFGPLVHAPGDINITEPSENDLSYFEFFTSKTSEMSSVLGYFENLHEQKDPASFMMLFGDHGPEPKQSICRVCE